MPADRSAWETRRTAARPITRRDVFTLGLVGISALLVPRARASDLDSSERIRVLYDNIPYPTDKNLNLGSMIALWPYEREGLTLQRIELIDHSSGALLAGLGRAELPKVNCGTLGNVLGVEFDTLLGSNLSLRLAAPFDLEPPTAYHYRLHCSGGQLFEGGVSYAPHHLARHTDALRRRYPAIRRCAANPPAR